MERTERTVANPGTQQPLHFILDVDGVLTDGTFYYSVDGKIMKRFGADDHDALKLLIGKLDIHIISSDHRGFEITKKRVCDDMHLPLDFVESNNRMQWIRKYYDPNYVIYMGDGIFDPHVFRDVLYGIAPSNALLQTQRHADFVTQKKGGEGAVAEACLHILDIFYNAAPTEASYIL